MVFDRLSIFSAHRALQLLKNCAAIRAPCLLCLADAGVERVCAQCVRSLPRSTVSCPRCALPMLESATCGRCLRHPPAFDATVCAFAYRFPVDRLVQRFKFAGDLAIGRWLGESLACVVAREERPDVLVATPLTRARLRERGFNQAVVLARIVGAAQAIRVEIEAVEKVRDTPAQHGLTRGERHANLREAFRVRRPMAGASVAIVDDVMTTGATAEAMARVLREAGARRVVAWVVARTPEPGH